MRPEQQRLRSRKINALAKKFADKPYRDRFVASRARRFLAHQMRELRGDLSQAEFGKVLDKPQSVVSRLEDPNYGKWSLQTILDVASKVDRAVIVQFVTFDEFLDFTHQEGRYETPAPYAQEKVVQDLRKSPILTEIIRTPVQSGADIVGGKQILDHFTGVTMNIRRISDAMQGMQGQALSRQLQPVSLDASSSRMLGGSLPQ